MTKKRQISYESDSSEDYESVLFESVETQTKRRNQRHTPDQIKRLEEIFSHCPKPSKNAWSNIGEEIGLEPLQVKFWFQNKRTQTKGKLNYKENNDLRAENDKLREENMIINKALTTDRLCCDCSCSVDGEEAERLFQLRAENARLREELARVSAIAAQFIGRPITDCTGSSSSSRDGN